MSQPSNIQKLVQQRLQRGKFQLNRRMLPPIKQHQLPPLFQTRYTPESTPRVFQRDHLKKPELQLISRLHLFPTSNQIAKENVHPKYPLNEKEKRKPHLMKKREAIFRNPQSVSHVQFNSSISSHDAKNDPNGNLTLRDALLVNMLADDIQSEVFHYYQQEQGLLLPKIGMPYDRVPAQSYELTQARTVDTLTLSLEQMEKPINQVKDHGPVLSVNLTAQWNPTLSKEEKWLLENKSQCFSKPEQYQIWEHAFLHGNWIRPHQTQSSIPQLLYPSDTNTLDSNKLYSIVMITPDYPYRLYSDPGVFVNWWVANVPGTSNCQQMNSFIQQNANNANNTFIDYLAPLPCEYGGVGRYLIMIFEQDRKLEKDFVTKCKEKTLDEKYKQSQRYLEHLKKTLKNMHWYEKEYAHTIIENKMIKILTDFDPSAFSADEIGDSEYRLDRTNSKVDDATLEDFQRRRGMSLEKMFNSNLPHGLCYGKIEYEYSVTEYLQEKGMAALEREYVPPDVVWQRMLGQNKNFKRQERYIMNKQWI
jgi:hypothetical protein